MARPRFTEQQVAARRARVPAVTYPTELPISARRDDILAALGAHQVVIVAGETGSGKTTQLPKMCLELGRGVRGMIGHTQPRRLAARTVAERIAEETGVELGDEVGYAVRFTDRVSDRTLVKVMTDGILLAELHRDRLLRAYDTIIIDEAHERSLNIDFLLGYLTGLLRRRTDLKLVVTSATIDTVRFSEHFGGAPVVEVSGRTYPVEVRYRPIEDDSDQVQAIADAVDEVWATGRGDVLVFLSGEREIRDAAEHLERTYAERGRTDVEILPLYARLSVGEQHRVFAPHRGRRVVLATNVAETSLTVPGIRFVVDPGTARISRFNRRTKVQRLPIERVSRASADQRAGRCGRVAPGIAIRLYAEEDYAARPQFTEPEMLRTNLAWVILQMAALELGAIDSFPFVDPPDSRAVRDGMGVLEEIGALDPGGRLTRLGRQIARLPVDPRFGRMLIEAAAEGSLAELLVITAGLSIQDPRERPADHREEAAAAHARFAAKDSDFLSILALWSHLQERQTALSSNQFRRLCRAEFLNFLRVREWQDLHAQLRRATDELGLPRLDAPAPPDAIHRAALAGLLSHIGMRDPERSEYRGARDSRFAIAPTSALARRGPRWVVAAELVETTRTWGRVAAPIEPAWAEQLGAHLVARSYGDPRWDARRGEAVTDERVTLFGLPIVTSRPVPYQRVDAATAREMFISNALVERDWDARPPLSDVLDANARVIDDVIAMEARARRPVYAGDDAVADFYRRRIDPDVVSGRSLERWWRRRGADDPMDIAPADVIDPRAEVGGPEDFPGFLHGFALTYVFDPGSDDDGVTVEVPLARLAQVDPAAFEWHVAGRRRELVAALIRTLPRAVRRDLPATTELATRFVTDTEPDGALIPRLERFLGVPPGSLAPESLPPHLRPSYRIVGPAGTTVARGRDLPEMQRYLRDPSRAAIAAAVGWEDVSNQTGWTFGRIARVVERGGVRAYPALLDEGRSVGLTVWATPSEQQREMWAGTARLIGLALPVGIRQLERRLGTTARLAVAELEVGSVGDLLDDCRTAAIDRVLDIAGGPAWDAEGFSVLVDKVRPDLAPTAEAVVSFAARILVDAAAVRRRLRAAVSTALADAVDDMQQQLRALVHLRFVSMTGAARLPDLLRYVRAIDRRLERVPQDPKRDHDRMDRVRALTTRYEAAARSTGAGPARRDSVRWMLEELRVSEFAQVLGTAYPVSVKRVERAIDDLAAGVVI